MVLRSTPAPRRKIWKLLKTNPSGMPEETERAPRTCTRFERRAFAKVPGA